MKKKKNYYEILKLSQDASNSQIKSSYKQLAKKYHPDLYVGDREFAEEKMKEINEAYEVLSNPQTKTEYDEFLNLQNQSSQTYTPTSPNCTPAEPQATKWSFSQFLFEKFSKLDKKHQLQIFITLFIFILALFLINLIEVKHYLTSQQTTPVPTNSTENTTIFNEISPNTFYEGNEIETLDDFLYDLFIQYQGNTMDESQF